MTKLEFLATLEKALAGLPKEDCKRIVDYYCEMIDDRMEDGVSEEDAVKAAGTLEEIAQQAAQEAPQERPRRKMRTAHALSGWEITLLVLGAPLWLPLLATFAALVLTVVAVMASVLATAYAVGLSLVACFAAGVTTAIQFASDNLPAQAAAYGGFALASAGLTVLAFAASNWTAKGLFTASKKALRGASALLATRGK